MHTKTSMDPRRGLRAACRAAGLATALLVGWLQQAPAAAAPAPRVAAPASAASAAAKALHRLFDEHWEGSMRRQPEWATYLGDHRYGDRLSDATRGAIAEDFATLRRLLQRARAIPRAGLSAKDRTSLEVFIHSLQDQLALEPHAGFRSMSLGAQGGFQTSLADLLDASPVAQRAQVEQMLARLAAYPTRVDQELVLLRDGLAARWVPPRTVLDRVLEQIDGTLPARLEDGPFFTPFTRLGSDIPAAEQEALRARARQVIAERVVPAQRRLRDFVAGEYLAAAPASGALGGYPQGDRVYALLVASHTTLPLSAQQIHETGVREVARIRAEMDAVMTEVRFDGDFAAFVKYLNTDPKFFHRDGEALLAGYREIAKRIDPELPRLFAELPRAPYGVRAMAPHFSAETSEFYSAPALDGSRPGWFNANAKAWQRRPIWGMETLVAHEAVPGHHLQIARAVELGELPRFRRSGGFTVYDEGWALYAETLGFELGLYKDPLSRFGHLQWQAFRAARLVVDTGLHAFGWSRQRAIDYLIDRTGEDPDYIASEVDRYISWPGQALSYMVGQMKIVELRDRAKARLGERFDIRQFHAVVLDQGAVPMPVLEQAVDRWVAGQAAPRRGVQRGRMPAAAR